MNTNETIKDILREMRNRADTVINGRAITERKFVPQEVVEEWADRIEAAWKRDVSYAIKAAMMAKCEVCHDVQGNAAELAPARNCDNYLTATEAKEAFFKAYFGPTEVGFWEGAYADWLLAEVEGGAE